MRHQLFIDGRWQDPMEPGRIPVFDPFRGTAYHEVSAGGPADVDKAVAAAKAAFPAWRDAGGRARARYLGAIAQRLQDRAEELARLSSRNNGKPIAEGTLLKNPAYADTLRLFAEEGAAPFYTGEIAEDIVAALNTNINPGMLTMEDLAAYEVVMRDPVCTDYRGFDVCGMGPPSSGGLTGVWAG